MQRFLTSCCRPRQLATICGVTLACIAPGAIAGTSAIPVETAVQGEAKTIGTLKISDEGDNITAEIELGDDFAFLHDWYEFRWINIITKIEKPDGTTVDSWGVVGKIPAIDPAPGDGIADGEEGDDPNDPDDKRFFPDKDWNDNKPFYDGDAEHEASPGFSDNRSSNVNKGNTIFFTTYLVVESKTDPNIGATKPCILAGFTWTSKIPATGGHGEEEQQTSIPSPGQADADAVNDAMDNATETEGEDFDGWEASAGCSLNACPEPDDSSVPGDADGDDDVDSADLNEVLGDFGCTGGDCPGDLDDDGDTDSADLNLVLGNFGFVAPPKGDCCVASGGLGCLDSECQTIVCIQFDPGCCQVAWDQACADIASVLCSVCFEPTNSCCVANGTPGCDGNQCPSIVCQADPFCCDIEWDNPCAEAASLNCPSCGGFTPAQGDCCAPNGSPGCDAADCQFGVCSIDPFCCQQLWDQACADQALAICEGLCDDPGPGFPDENRGVAEVNFIPGSAPGLYDVEVVWFVETNSTDVFKDLSADIFTSVNGQQLPGAVNSVATIAAAGGACLGTTPPCSGDDCGTWTIGPLTLNGSCLKSIATIIGIDFCTCACAVIDISVTDVPLSDGDEVTVVLEAAAGALPDIVLEDNQLTVAFVEATGACCLPDGTCTEGPISDCPILDPLVLFFEGQTCDEIDCGNQSCTPCPPGAIDEGEDAVKACGTVEDNYNGGCNSPGFLTLPLAPGDTYCGTAFAQDDTRDTDWFQVDSFFDITYTITFQADFDAAVFAIDASDCANIVLIADASAPACQQQAVSFDVPAGQALSVFVAPANFDGVSCNGANTYTLSLEGEAIPQLGACCFGNGKCADAVSEQECANFPGLTDFHPGASCDVVFCGDPPDSDCCFPNGSPGCSDPQCVNIICQQDPFCCETEWDGICADAALEQCPVCQGNP